MTKDFDAEYRERLAQRDRDFILGGQTFTLVGDVHPSTIIRYDTMGENMSAPEVFNELFELAPLFVTAERRAAFAELIRRQGETEIDEVGAFRLQGFIEWATEQVTGRPFPQSEASSADSLTPPSQTPSTGRSSSEESTSNGSASAASATSSTASPRAT